MQHKCFFNAAILVLVGLFVVAACDTLDGPGDVEAKLAIQQMCRDVQAVYVKLDGDDAIARTWEVVFNGRRTQRASFLLYFPRSNRWKLHIAADNILEITSCRTELNAA